MTWLHSGLRKIAQYYIFPSIELNNHKEHQNAIMGPMKVIE